MPFVKGQSGNPGGRPKKADTLTGILEELSKKAPPGKRKARKVLLAEKLWQLAINDSDMAAIKYIYDRLDGKPTESVEHSGPDGGSIVLNISHDESKL